MDSPEWFFLTLLRFLIPLAILRWPLAGICMSIAADAVFSNMLGLPHGGFQHYQIWDKVLDTYYLAIAAYTSYFWLDKQARAVSLFSFGYRAIGVVLFLITDNLSLLFLFPNFFENFFIFYLLFRKFAPGKQLFSSVGMFIAIITAILIPKLTQEYFMHVAFLRLDNILQINVELWPTSLNVASALQWILYFVPPILVLLWRLHVTPRLAVKRSRRHTK